jgi:phage-related protein (TIGR01555 family)
MFSKIKGFFAKKIPVPTVDEFALQQQAIRERASFSTYDDGFKIPKQQILDRVFRNTFQREVKSDAIYKTGVAMDEDISTMKFLSTNFRTQMPLTQLDWYGSQGFIGFPLCTVIAQNWLVYKACHMPAQDAVRKGYEITSNDGTKLDAKILDAIKKGDKKYRLNAHLKEFLTNGRIFGIRIAIFKVDYDDPHDYELPFNPDGIRPGTYKGIVQVDPYWMTPELDGESSSDPSSMYFYEPTWWRVNGIRYHRTHLVIMRHAEVADLLKPTYYYAGVPLTQQIFERIYAAERTANEAPLLALTKRTTVLKVDMSKFIMNQKKAEDKINKFAWFRDNYGIKLADLEEQMEQFDTSLSDLDAVIMSQFQLVASVAGVPAAKLLGTTPKGFNSTGEFEEASYHEELESMQEHYLSPLLERHHELLIRSEIAPKFNGGKIFSVSVTWKPTDSMTAKEKAELNKLKADTAAELINTGAISNEDERKRLTNDPESGYNGIDDLSENSDLEERTISSSELDDPEENDSGFRAQGSLEPL